MYALASLLTLAALVACSPGALADDLDKGKSVFQACRHCHNVRTDARKAGPSLRTLFGKVRLGNGKRANEENIIHLITEGYNGMPSYRYMLRPDDWTHLLAYLRTLRARPEVAPVLKTIRGADEEILAAGKKHYSELCASCHQTLGPNIEEATVVPLIREGHATFPAKKEALDEAALFSLIAFLKAR